MNQSVRVPTSSDPAGIPFAITKIAPITKPVRPPLGPNVRRNAASPTTTKATAADAAALS